MILNPVLASHKHDEADSDLGQILLVLDAAIGRNHGLETRIDGSSQKCAVGEAKPAHLADGSDLVPRDGGREEPGQGLIEQDAHFSRSNPPARLPAQRSPALA